MVNRLRCLVSEDGIHFYTLDVPRMRYGPLYLLNLYVDDEWNNPPYVHDGLMTKHFYIQLLRGGE